ncbi:MAG TPA: hypothetical protein ENF29_01310 [Candidatus Acetothermia bacterium]|nr:hypothetical protein [Candidatus Acetothermia bacterium]
MWGYGMMGYGGWMFLWWIGGLFVFGAVIYAAVRLGIHHEYRDDGSGPSGYSNNCRDDRRYYDREPRRRKGDNSYWDDR